MRKHHAPQAGAAVIGGAIGNIYIEGGNHKFFILHRLPPSIYISQANTTPPYCFSRSSCAVSMPVCEGDLASCSKVFPGYLGIRKSLRAGQQDVRGSRRSLAEVSLATPTMQAVQKSWSGLGTLHVIWVWVFGWQHFVRRPRGGRSAFC
jgi:hypothetical protein